MKKKKKLILFFVILIAIVAVIFVFVKKGSAKNEGTESVTTDTVKKGDIREAITTTGKVAAMNSYSVWPLSGVEGKITKADFKVGDTVKKGQVLYKVSSESLDEKINTAKDTLKRKQETYQHMEENTQKALEKYSKYAVLAPSDGYVKNLQVKTGDTLVEGSTIIATIYNNKTMKLTIPFPSELISDKSVGKKAVVTLSYSGDEVDGTVTEVSDYTEKLSQNRVVRYATIEVKNPGGIAKNDKATARIGSVYASDEGTFAPEYEGTVTSTVSGIVDVISIKEGDWAAKKEALVKIKGDTYLTQTNEAEEQLTTAKADVKDAKSQLKSLEKEKKNYEITSPINGKIVKKNLKQGDTINSTTAKDALCLIYDLSAMNFSMMVDETDIQKLSEGQKISITADALPGETFEGKITSISMEANISDGGVTQYPVLAQIDLYGSMLPGMNVSGEIVIKEAKDVLCIPSEALVRGNLVYVKDEKAKAEDGVPAGFRSQEVEIGVSDGTNIEITDGLSEGDEIYIPEAEVDLGSEGVMYAD
ncbi:MAG: HlyD family secretion protein [Clostridiales bacterium]|nr:HlyD family secretion protein [Clostridiales bacterium]